MIYKFYFFISFLLPNIVFAYAQYIGHGYTSCITCHYNPMGNGPISDYGRGVAATAISDRSLYASSVSEEKLSDMSGFFFKTPKQKYFRPSLDARSLNMTRGMGQDTKSSDFIMMRAAIELVFQFSKKIFAVSEMSYAPKPRFSMDDQGNYRSREHYIGYRPTYTTGFYLGLMDKVFGIRIPDHNLQQRILPALTMNDQVHGLMAHYVKENIEGAIHYFSGNLNQDADLREKGFSGKFEYLLGDFKKLGLSYLNSKNTYKKLEAMAIHGKLGFNEGAAILLEVGQVQKESIQRNTEIKSTYFFAQGYLRLRRGLYILETVEYFKRDSALEPYNINWGPGLQYYPLQRLELRAEVINRRYYATDNAQRDSFDLLLQTHVYF